MAKTMMAAGPSMSGAAERYAGRTDDQLPTLELSGTIMVCQYDPVVMHRLTKFLSGTG